MPYDHCFDRTFGKVFADADDCDRAREPIAAESERHQRHHRDGHDVPQLHERPQRPVEACGKLVHGAEERDLPGCRTAVGDYPAGDRYNGDPGRRLQQVSPSLGGQATARRGSPNVKWTSDPMAQPMAAPPITSRGKWAPTYIRANATIATIVHIVTFHGNER
jgi:hypothetical protein